MDLLKRMKDIEKTFNKDYIIESLSKGLCKVTFLKVDGSTRIMNGTLNREKITNIIGYEQSEPIEPKVLSETTKKEIDPDLIKLFDVDAKGWRSFKISRMKAFEIVEGK